MSWRKFRGVGMGAPCALVGVALCAVTARAGQGPLNAPLQGETYGRMTLNVNFRFPPTQTQIDKVKKDLRMASRVLCDATEGLVRIKHVSLSAGAPGEAEADVWILDNSEDIPSNVPPLPLKDAAGMFTNITGFTAGPGVHVEQFYRHLTESGGGVFAHELMHYALTISDQYPHERRDWSPCSHGGGLDDPDLPPQPGEAGIAALMDETINTLAQRNPGPECYRFDPVSNAWVRRNMSCSDESDCPDPMADRCFVRHASEFNMSRDYFDLEHGTADENDCPPARASTTVYLARDGGIVTLGDTTATNTDDFNGKTYAQAEVAAAMVTEVEVIDSAGVYVGEYNRSSHQMMLYYQKRSADLWRVWMGFDANKMPGGTPGADPVLAIVGSFDIELDRGQPGCGDGMVQANLDEECDALPGDPVPMRTVTATASPMSTRGRVTLTETVSLMPTTPMRTTMTPATEKITARPCSTRTSPTTTATVWATLATRFRWTSSSARGPTCL